MSIQSEIDRITNEVNEQTSLISQIKTALEGKSGGSVATCRVKILDDGFYTQMPITAVYAAYENGGIVTKYKYPAINTMIENEEGAVIGGYGLYENVVKGSQMIFLSYDVGNYSFSGDGIETSGYDEEIYNSSSLWLVSVTVLSDAEPTIEST